MTLLEGEDEETVEAAFDTLAERGIRLGAFRHSQGQPYRSGAARLHLEEKLAKSEHIAENLPEEDPLRLYLRSFPRRKGTPWEKCFPRSWPWRENMWATACC